MTARDKGRTGDFLIPLLTVLFDALAIEFSFLFSYWLRIHSTLFDVLGFVDENAPPIEGYLLGSLFIVPIWLMLFQFRRMYSTRRNVPLVDELINIVKVVTLGMLIVMSAAFFYRDFSYSRIVFGLMWGSSVVFIFLGRAAIQWYERRQYRKGKHLQTAILIGNDAIADEVYTRLNRHPSFGFTIVGYFSDAPAQPGFRLASAPHLGSMQGTVEYITTHNIELVFVALRSQDHPALFNLVTECEGVRVQFMMVPDVLELMTSQVRVKELEGVPFLNLKNIPLTVWGRILKRSFDLLVSGLLLVVLAPLSLVIIIFIRLTSRGPILFVQERVGLDGRPFTMYKFRSMKMDAEKDSGPVWAKEGDSRRTTIGAFLRKTSLDELPQLFNVLRGDMSLVGPRPERPFFVDQFRHLVPKYLDRHRVKTGMTGWAQVNGLRGNTSLEERLKYDLYYIENWSMGFDMKILLRTLRAALSMKEAH